MKRGSNVKLNMFCKTAISQNIADKPAILNHVLDSQKEGKIHTFRPPVRMLRRTVAAAVAVMLLMSAFMVVLALTKSAKLELTVVNACGSETISPGDTMILTASIANPQGLKKGIHGFTMDLSYDQKKLDYADNNIITRADGVFTVCANEAVPGTITVLFFANDDTGPLSSVNADSGLFSMTFTVRPDAAGTCSFIPSACQFADLKDDETGFELIDIELASRPLKVIIHSGS